MVNEKLPENPRRMKSGPAAAALFVVEAFSVKVEGWEVTKLSMPVLMKEKPTLAEPGVVSPWLATENMLLETAPFWNRKAAPGPMVPKVVMTACAGAAASSAKASAAEIELRNFMIVPPCESCLPLRPKHCRRSSHMNC